jgi:adhesin transport system outer membrane protein
MSSKVKTKILSSIVASSIILFGQQASALTLEQSVLEAMNTNPVVQERLNNFRQTQQDLVIAESEWLPKLDWVSTVGVAQAGKIKDVVDDVNYEYYTNMLKLTQNLFNGFSTTHKIEYQEARILAAAHHYVENANDIAFQMVGAYLDLIRSYKLLQIAKNSLNNHQKIYEDVQELYNSGLTTHSEVTKIQSSLALAQSNVMVQENNTLDKKFRFKRLFGRDIALHELTLPELSIAMPESIERATMIAIENNPSILVSNYNIQGAQSLYHESKSKFYPIINLEIEQYLNDSHKRDNGYERVDDRSRAYVSLTWNFYNGGADEAARQKQISNMHQEVEIQRDLKRQVIEGLELSWSAYTMIQNQLTHLYSYKDFSEQTLDNYIEEYELGRRTLLDLLSAQNDLTNSENEIINAEFDRLHAQYRILDAMGLLIETVVQKEKYSNIVQPIEEPFVIQEDTLPVNKDVDRDGIADNLDICDNSTADNGIMPYGCVKGMKDSDYDGVADILDRCPETKIGTIVDQHGCSIENEKNKFENDPQQFLTTPVKYNETSAVKGEEEGLYDYLYSHVIANNVASSSMDKKLMYEDFDLIKRFEPVLMQEKTIDVDDIVDFYNSLDESEYIITVIGHTQKMDDLNESKAVSMDYAKSVTNKLVDAGIDEKIIITEARAFLDKAFLETYEEFAHLNERVMVAIYEPKQGLGDADGDGVIDLVDNCPQTPQGIDVDFNGCALDSDGDGVANYKDECPSTPQGYSVDEKGCTLLIDLKITFENNSALIKTQQEEQIKEFAQFLKDHDSYKAIVTGHTSITGNESRTYNIELSKKRANSIKQELINLGVNASQVQTVGKGGDEPVASNDTAQGRAQNRRIEAVLVKQKQPKEPKKQQEAVPSGWGIN